MDSIGDRMKANYEDRYRIKLTRRTPVIIRVDGRCFHTYTRHMNRPFDIMLATQMVDGARRTMDEIQGCKLAYVQSDEASFLLTDYDTLQTQAWFDYNLQKLASVTASLMTAHFNALRPELVHNGLIATFDARAFNIPESEVSNYFLWRAKDWRRNSVRMAAASVFSDSELFGRSADEVEDMLADHGWKWSEHHSYFRYGTFVIPYGGPWEAHVEYAHPTYEDVSEIVDRVLPCLI